MDQNEESNRYIPDDVWERLRQQQASFMIEERRNQVLERIREEEESRISRKDQETDTDISLIETTTDDENTGKINEVNDEFEKLLEDDESIMESVREQIEEMKMLEIINSSKLGSVKYKRQTLDEEEDVARYTLNLTEKDASATFLRDKNYYCLQTENWIDEVEYRSSL